VPASSTDSCRAPARRGGAGALLALLIAVAACGPFRGQYEPRIPTGARSGDVELGLVHVVTGKQRDFVFTARADSAHALKRGWLTVPTRAPCSGGEELEQVIVDDAITGMLPPGTHELRATIPAKPFDLQLDTVMDFEIEGGCLRTPAVSQSVPLVARRRPTLAFTTSVDGNTALSGMQDLVAFRLGGGTWLGPVLAIGELGLGVAECKKDVCGENDSGGPRNRMTVSGAASAHVLLVSGHLLGDFSALTMGARYSFAPVTVPALDGDRRFAVHAVQLVPGWSVGYGGVGPFQHRERGPMMQMTVPIGVLHAPGAPRERTAFVMGLELRVLLPI
jgi:hypothetical protein